jgi:hypothetical protein
VNHEFLRFARARDHAVIVTLAADSAGLQFKSAKTIPFF